MLDIDPIYEESNRGWTMGNDDEVEKIEIPNDVG